MDPLISDPTYLEASSAAFARTVAEFFKTLVHNGLTCPEAQVLTATWVNALVMSAGLNRLDTPRTIGDEHAQDSNPS